MSDPRVAIATAPSDKSRVWVTNRDVGNLALHVGDDETVVRANRARLAQELGVAHVQFMHQVHGNDVAFVDTATETDAADVDALITTTPGVAIAVLVADCVPVVIGGERCVAVVHAGRPGVAADVIGATIRRIRDWDRGPLHAYVGPAVCGRCYEVPASMQADVAAVEPAALATTRRGTPALDLPAAVRAQLRRRDVAVESDDGPCTLEDADYFSYRRDGVTGRFAAVAMLVG